MDQHNVELVANGVEPAERGIHGKVEAMLRVTVARHLVEAFRPLDVRTCGRGLERHAEQALETGIFRHIF